MLKPYQYDRNKKKNVQEKRNLTVYNSHKNMPKVNQTPLCQSIFISKFSRWHFNGFFIKEREEKGVQHKKDVAPLTLTGTSQSVNRSLRSPWVPPMTM